MLPGKSAQDVGVRDGGGGQEGDGTEEAGYSQEGGSISRSIAHRYPNLLPGLPGSTWTCASYITGTGPSKPSKLACAYSKEASRGRNSPTGATLAQHQEHQELCRIGLLIFLKDAGNL